jgi:hypothetical protein
VEAQRLINMPPIDDLDLMLDDPAAAMPMARDFLALEEEPEELALEEMEPQDDPRELYEKLIANIKATNIAEDMDEDELSAIGQKVLREYEIDLASRSEWEDKSRKAMDLAMQIAKNKTHPWPGASNVIFPLMTTAAVQFAARAYPAIVQGRNVVKGVVTGKDDGTPMPPEMVQMLQQGLEWAAACPCRCRPRCSRGRATTAALPWSKGRNRSRSGSSRLAPSASAPPASASICPGSCWRR